MCSNVRSKLNKKELNDQLQQLVRTFPIERRSLQINVNGHPQRNTTGNEAMLIHAVVAMYESRHHVELGCKMSN